MTGYDYKARTQIPVFVTASPSPRPPPWTVIISKLILNKNLVGCTQSVPVHGIMPPFNMLLHILNSFYNVCIYSLNSVHLHILMKYLNIKIFFFHRGQKGKLVTKMFINKLSSPNSDRAFYSAN